MTALSQMEKASPKEYYDVVIIGAGISGLTSAALFRRAGLSCCVLEAHDIAGGYIQGFNRGSFQFDSAIHWLNSCGPDGFASRIFKIIGSDYPKPKEQKRIRRFVSDDFDYLVTNNPDALKEQWIEEFPDEKKGILKFFADAKGIARAFKDHQNISRTIDSKNWYKTAVHGLRMLKFILPFAPHLKYTGNEGVKKGLSKYFTDSKLKGVFCSETDLLSCLIPVAFAYSNDFQSPPEGGSQRFPEWLTYVTQQLGGDIFFKSKVSDILIENNKAIGVRFGNNGSSQEIKSKYVIAACDLEALFEKMLPPSVISDQLKAKQKAAKLYASGFTVSLELDCPAEDLGLGEEIIYLANPKLEREELASGDPNKTGIHVMAPSVRDKSLALPEHGILTLFIPAWIDNHKHWECEIDEKGNYIRGEKYKKLKQQIADVLIDRVQEKIIPNLRDHISHCDIATPITYLRYTGNRNGSMMGQKPGKENMQARVASYKTPIKNLFRSGHWSDLGGGIPIAVKASLNTTLMVLKKENRPVFKLLANYMDGIKDIESLNSSDLLVPYDNSWEPIPTPAQEIVSKRK